MRQGWKEREKGENMKEEIKRSNIIHCLDPKILREKREKDSMVIYIISCYLT